MSQPRKKFWKKKPELTPEIQRKRMLEKPMPKLILTMIIPAVITQLITVIYNTTDTFFVARIGTSAAAAMGVVFSLQSIVQAYGYGVGTGVGALASLHLGAAENEKAEMYSNSSLFLAFAGGIFMTVVCLLNLPGLMRLLGSTETMLDYCVDYARIILIGCTFMCLSSALTLILRSEGEPGYAMIGNVLGGFVNVALDPILIFKLGWGMQGAAIATVIGQIISFLVLLSPFLTGRSIMRIHLRYISYDWRVYWEIFSTGLPTFFRQGMASIGSALLTVTVARYGDAAVAAITISNKIYLLVRNIVLGVGQGFQPVAGYNYGAGNMKRTRESFVFSTQLGTAICLVATVFIGLKAELVISWFQSDPEVVAIGIDALHYVALVMPFLAYSTFVNQLYQCLGFKVQATILACCRNGIFLIPILFIVPNLLGLTGVEMAQPLADFLFFLISIPYQVYFFKTKLAKENIFEQKNLA